MNSRDLAREIREHFATPLDRAFLTQPIAAWRRQTREALGLPLDRPIIMTGHQAGIWHAGIAEKFVVAAALCKEVGGVLVHLVVDHDCNDASLVSYPALLPSPAPSLDQGVLTRLALERSPRGAGPNALRKPVRLMRPTRTHEIPASLASPLARIEAAVACEFGRENLALQMAHAANALLAPWAKVDATITATALSATPLALALRANFAPLRAHYNAALTDQRIAPLASDELPFWVLERPSTRRPFRDADHANAQALLTAPRALTLTLLARLAACDLFIHGTGGAKYDLAMEQWITAALGQPARALLAPMSVATATRLAPLASFAPSLDSCATVASLRARMHDPFADGGARKRAFVSAIHGSRAEKRVAYLDMHRALTTERQLKSEEFARLAASIATNAVALRAQSLASDRTWPFPFTMPFTMPMSTP